MYASVAALCLHAALAAPPANHSFSAELIFPLQSKHVHSSSIVECPNGDLLCTWFHGSGERTSPDVVIQGSRLRPAKTDWDDVFEMADTPDLPDCNPILFIDPENHLRLFWIVVPADRWEDSLLRFRISSDYESAGPPKWSWQDDLFLKPGDRFATEMARRFCELEPHLPGENDPKGLEIRRYMSRLQRQAWSKSKRQRGWMTRCHMTVLPSGRLLLPLYSDGFLACLMAISDDGGKHWRSSSPIIGPGLNQPTVVRRKDGTLLAYMRAEGGFMSRVLASESKDDGETWSLALPTETPNPNSSLEAIALQDGRWVMVYNDSAVEDFRHKLTVQLSDDEGRSWRWKRDLENTPGGSFHYPSVIQTRDGKIHVTYTYKPAINSDKSIKHVSFDPDWIKDAP